MLKRPNAGKNGSPFKQAKKNTGVFFRTLCTLEWINFFFFENFKLPHAACAQERWKNHL